MYKSIVRPLLKKTDHEETKSRIIDILHAFESNPIGLKIIEQLGYKGKRFTNPKLKTEVAGITFDNPVIMAAGWDKEARAANALYQLGYAGVEIGTVTAYPQIGNVKPRLHLLDDEVMLNHMGFNGPGMEAVAQNLKRYQKREFPIGINVGKNKYIPSIGAGALYAVVVRRLYELGDYFVINVSSPNTVGLKALQGKKFLEEIVKEVNNIMDDIGGRKPTFVKIAPDISFKELDGIIDVVTNHKLAGIIAVNTFPHNNSLAKYGQVWEDRQGGLSGNDKHYRNIGIRYLAYIHQQTQGKVTTIGVGGVHDSATALEKIAAGASLVQTFTGLFVQGPSLPGKINHGLLEYMEKENIKSLDEIRGIDAKKILENKDNYSFFFIKNDNSLESLKKDYFSALFKRNNLDTLLISKNPFTLKHGELGRKWSRIYLNHRNPLFAHMDFRKLFAKILEELINENILTNTKKDYGLISLPTLASPELASLIESNTKKIYKKVTLLTKSLLKSEKGTNTKHYGNFDDTIPWVSVDDVFTSGQTIKDTILQLSKEGIIPKKIFSVSLVARNPQTINTFESKTNTKLYSFVTLDEILQYHWKSFSANEKRIIKGERIALN